MTVLVLAAQPWAQDTVEVLQRTHPDHVFARVSTPTEMIARLDHAALVLSLHWHWRVSPDIVSHWHCVGFHASDLPNFRGGAPIQNQVKRGILDTKLTMFRLDEGLDTGPILLQRALSLRGSMDEVLARIGPLVVEMTGALLAGRLEEHPQPEGGSCFTRADALA